MAIVYVYLYIYVYTYICIYYIYIYTYICIYVCIFIYIYDHLAALRRWSVTSRFASALPADGVRFSSYVLELHLNVYIHINLYLDISIYGLTLKAPGYIYR